MKLLEVEEKTCLTCGETKPFADYHRNCQSKDGYLPNCKRCIKKKYRVSRSPAVSDRSMRAIAAARSDKTKRGRPSKQKQTEIAEEFDISLHMLGFAKELLASAPDLARQVEEGELTLWAARKKAGLGVPRIPYREVLAEMLLEKQEHKCNDCGTPLTPSASHIDHIKPVSLGGSQHHSNLQALCKSCNLTKSNKMPQKR